MPCMRLSVPTAGMCSRSNCRGVQVKSRLTEILALAAQKKIQVVKAPRARLDKIHENNQGIIAEVSKYPYVDLLDIFENARRRTKYCLSFYSTLQRPQNFGTLIRTAEAIGVHGVVIPLAHTVEVTPSVVNASPARASTCSLHSQISRRQSTR